MERLLDDIKSLTADDYAEVVKFVGYLKIRKRATETMILSEGSLDDWNTPEEDEAWADL